MDFDITRTVEYHVYAFKILSCPLKTSHDWSACPWAHPKEQARRRDPRRYHYMPVLCPYAKAGAFACPKGDHCDMAHQVYELWLHPLKFRSELCRKGPLCDRRLCFFAHRPEELRTVTKEQLIAAGAMAPPPQQQAGGVAPGLVPPGLTDPTGGALAAAAAAAAASAMGSSVGLSAPEAAAAAAAAGLGMAGGDLGAGSAFGNPGMSPFGALGAQQLMAMAGPGAAASLYMGALANAQQLAEGSWGHDMAAALGAAQSAGVGVGQAAGGFGAGNGGFGGGAGGSLMSASQLWGGPRNGDADAAAGGLAFLGSQHRHHLASHGASNDSNAAGLERFLQTGPPMRSPPRRFGSDPLPAQPPPPPPHPRVRGAGHGGVPPPLALPQQAELAAFFRMSGQRSPGPAGGGVNGGSPQLFDALPPPSPPPPALSSAGARHSAPLPFSPRLGSAPPTPPSTSLSAPLSAPQIGQQAAAAAEAQQRVAAALTAAMAAAPGGAAQLEALAAELRELSVGAAAAGGLPGGAPPGGEGGDAAGSRMGVVEALAAALRAELDAIALMGPNGGTAAAAAGAAPPGPVGVPRGEGATLAGGAAPSHF